MIERNKNFSGADALRRDAGMYEIQRGNPARGIVWGFIFSFLLYGLIALFGSGCAVHMGIDWNGKTEVVKTTKSPATVDKHLWW